jgi:F420H(2)-dependent quinone reductase
VLGQKGFETRQQFTSVEGIRETSEPEPVPCCKGVLAAGVGKGVKAASAAPTPSLPPRWFIRLAWVVHRAIYRFTGGRRGLALPKPGRFGLLRLTTVGRRTGTQRSVILGYYEDGPNLVTLAMNGWGKGEPAWWLNLRARPDATVVLKDGRRMVRARAAHGEERTRLWDGFRAYSGWGSDVDAYARLRPAETAVVVLEPRM